MGRVLVLVALLLLASGGLPAAGADDPINFDSRPTLRVVGLYPLTVHGANFRSVERVRLTVRAQTMVVRTVHATARGRFSTQFRVRVARCGTATVRAVGNRGSRAIAQLPGPNCRNPLERGEEQPLIRPGK